MKDTLIMDSGAFSAWMKGIAIDLDAYTQFCLDNLEAIDYVVNLDCIPSKYGVKLISKREIERSARLGWKNYQHLLRAGIPKEKLIHVFHQSEDFRWLRKMVEAMPYIGLSPANDRTTGEKVKWLNECMKYVTDKKGYPIVKFHGFAVTSHRIMNKYPWYSVDSSSWVLQAGYGVVYVPHRRDGKWDYINSPRILFFSSRSPKVSLPGQRHYTTLTPRQKKQVDLYLEETGMIIGHSDFISLPSEDYKPKEGEKKTKDGMLEVIKESGLCNDFVNRAYANALFLNGYQRTAVPWPKKRFKFPVLKGLGFKGGRV